MKKKLTILVGLLMATVTQGGYYLQVDNTQSSYPVHTEWKRTKLGGTNWNELVPANGYAQHDTGLWCTQRVNITPVIDGKNAGVITLNTPGFDCQSFILRLDSRGGVNFKATLIGGPGQENSRTVPIEALKRDEKFQD